MKPEQDKLDIIRANVNDVIEQARKEYDHNGMRVLEVGLLKGGAKDTFKFAQVETLDIIEGGDYCFDLCHFGTLGSFQLMSTFDAIICTEVLEHTSQPLLACSSLLVMLRKGGTVYVTTPYNFRIHNPLPDNWRFTEHGLRELFKDFKGVDIQWRGGYELNPVCYRLTAKK